MSSSSSSQGAVGRVNRRAVARRGLLAWACRGIAALLAAGYALGLTASGAVAGQVPVIFQYSCQLPLIGGQSLTTTFVWPSSLQTATAGTHTPSLPAEVTGTVAAAARTLVRFVGIEWIEGTADVSAEIMAPQGDIGEDVHLTVPLTDVSTGSGPLAVPASGPIPSVLLSQTGQAKVVVGSVAIHLATLSASGAPSILGNIDIPCTLDPGQTGVVSSLQILPAAPATARSSPTAHPAPRPTPTQTHTPAPGPTSTHARTQTPAPSPRPSPPDAWAGLLRHSAPLARSFPGILLLALLLLCAAVLVILKAALRIFNIGLAVRNPSAKRSPSNRPPGTSVLRASELRRMPGGLFKASAPEPHAAGACARSPTPGGDRRLPGQRARPRPDIAGSTAHQVLHTAYRPGCGSPARFATEWSPQLAPSYGSGRSLAGRCVLTAGHLWLFE